MSDIGMQIRALIDEKRTLVDQMVAEAEENPHVPDDADFVEGDIVALALAKEKAEVEAKIKELTRQKAALDELLKGMFGEHEMLVSHGVVVGTYKRQTRVEVNAEAVKEAFPASEYGQLYRTSERRVLLLDPALRES